MHATPLLLLSVVLLGTACGDKDTDTDDTVDTGVDTDTDTDTDTGDPVSEDVCVEDSYAYVLYELRINDGQDALAGSLRADLVAAAADEPAVLASEWTTTVEGEVHWFVVVADSEPAVAFLSLPEDFSTAFTVDDISLYGNPTAALLRSQGERGARFHEPMYERLPGFCFVPESETCIEEDYVFWRTKLSPRSDMSPEDVQDAIRSFTDRVESEEPDSFFYEFSATGDGGMHLWEFYRSSDAAMSHLGLFYDQSLFEVFVPEGLSIYGDPRKDVIESFPHNPPAVTDHSQAIGACVQAAP